MALILLESGFRSYEVRQCPIKKSIRLNKAKLALRLTELDLKSSSVSLNANFALFSRIEFSKHLLSSCSRLSLWPQIPSQCVFPAS